MGYHKRQNTRKLDVDGKSERYRGRIGLRSVGFVWRGSVTRLPFL
jgi:hypothetical protein